KHIEEAIMEDVKAFFNKFYLPNNAIMAITVHVTVAEEKRLEQKWFEDIHAVEKNLRNLPMEPKQTSPMVLDVTAEVHVDAIYIAFHTVGRLHQDYQTIDLITDILSRGNSSRLYRGLIKEQKLFSEVNAYVLGSIDHNLLVVEGKPLEKVSLEQAEEALWSERSEEHTS